MEGLDDVDCDWRVPAVLFSYIERSLSPFFFLLLPLLWFNSLLLAGLVMYSTHSAMTPPRHCSPWIRKNIHVERKGEGTKKKKKGTQKLVYCPNHQYKIKKKKKKKVISNINNMYR